MVLNGLALKGFWGKQIMRTDHKVFGLIVFKKNNA